MFEEFFTIRTKLFSKNLRILCDSNFNNKVTLKLELFSPLFGSFHTIFIPTHTAVATCRTVKNLKLEANTRVLYFSDHKAHLKSFNFLKNRKCAL